MAISKKKKIGYLKLESCGGCINSLINHKNIFEIMEHFEIYEYDSKKEYDLVLIEGHPYVETQKNLVKTIEKNAKKIAFFGSCAISPKLILGIDLNENPENLKNIKKLEGCPVDEEDLMDFLKNELIGINLKPEDNHILCKTCQDSEIKCIKFEGIKCLGEKTIGGCKILCPKIKRSCTGCKTFAKE